MKNFEIENIYELAPIQSGLLFESIYQSTHGVYFIQGIYELIGELDVIFWKQAWQIIIQNNEILRASFVWEDLKKPLQVIHKKVYPTWNDENWVGRSNIESQIQNLAKQELEKGFNLKKSPLMRFNLIKINKKKYYFIWNNHHIITDGWSVSIILKDVYDVYISLVSNTPISLNNRRNYRDYIAWLKVQDNQKAHIYWNKVLNGVLPTKLGGKESSTDGQYVLRLSAVENKKLIDTAKQLNITTNTFMQGVWAIILSKYTRQQDIVFGVTISGRHVELMGIEDIVGIFINTIPLRIKFTSDETIKSLFTKIQNGMAEAQDNSYVSLSTIQAEQNYGGRGLFDNIFVYENYPNHEQSYKKNKILSISQLGNFEKTEYALVVTLEPSNSNQLEIKFNYSGMSFTYEQVKKMAANVRTLITNITNNPTNVVGNLSLLTDHENLMLKNWNNTDIKYPEDKCIQELFEQVVFSKKDRIAVVYENEQLTYDQLNKQSNRLARYLTTVSGTFNKIPLTIGIVLGRSVDMIIAMLACLKAGVAYVPIEINYPKKRIRYILEDSNSMLVLTNRRYVHLIENNIQIILVDQVTLPTSDSNLLRYNITSLIYVLYTSGSTGLPKGSDLIHSGVSNLLNWYKHKFLINEADRILIFTSFGFDLTQKNILGGLISGSQINLSSNIKFDPIYLIKYININKVTFINCPPSAFYAISENLDEKNNLPSLRIILLGGEVINTSKLRLFLKYHNQCKIINTYGPTECSDLALTHSITSEELDSSINIPLGRNVGKVTIYIVDPYLNKVPIGNIGEIYIGGAGLARGYFNKPELTAERFIANPFKEEYKSEIVGTRIYKTGDLGRYLPNGNVEFLGRVDYQVKIRGFRIELEEIESVILSTLEVNQCTVLVREDKPSYKRIVAYVVPKKVCDTIYSVDLNSTSKSTFLQSIRYVCKQKLPDYMQPSQIILLNQLPLTPNGKLDRKALPDPEFGGDSSSYVAPRNEVEAKLCSIFAEVLGLPVDKVGIYDNFFNLGGDSIISIQLVSKARLKKLYFTVQDVFHYSDIASLSLVIKSEENISVIQPDQYISGDVLLTPIQHWFFKNNHIEYNYFNQEALLLVNKRLDLTYLNEALKILIYHHDSLRMRYYFNNNQWTQECLGSDNNPICSLIDLSSIQDNQLSINLEKFSLIAHQSININNGPIIKAVLFDCGEKRAQRFLIVIHHLVVDGISWRILIEDLETIYSQITNHSNLTLLPKTHSYKQWANFLSEYSMSKVLKEEIPYWQGIHKSAESFHTDFNKGSALCSKSFTISVSLTKQDTLNLLQKVNKAYSTQINDILLTALVLSMGDWKKKYTLTLYLEGHGREDIIDGIDISRTIGWFTSIFPIHLKISDSNDISKAIKEVKRELRLVPKKGIGYGVLYYLSNDSQLLSSFNNLPIPSLIFNYLGQWDNTIYPKGIFSFSNESAGKNTSEKNNLSYLLSINSEIKNQTLNFFFTYSSNHYYKQTIKDLSHRFIYRLKQLIEHCIKENVADHTSSDFDLEATDITDLEKRLSYIPGDNQ